MFYVLIFSLMAVVLVVAGLSAMRRSRSRVNADEGPGSPQQPHAGHTPRSDTARRTRKEKRAQSRHDRRKRH